ncbi:glycoside hydrolase superfamily [Kockiozyma suomiensis]|uniref:glycoside hydrolase superfamily n=1 Tax=Kockiozyma suomiensis TaxID=1337062 RepID=UPI003344168D
MAEKEMSPTPENATLLQAFEWYIPDDHTHWKRLARDVPKYRDMGITALWIPPPCKASSSSGNGYDIYDLWDLGEFDQKGSKPTKWGSKDDLLELSAVAENCNVLLYTDAVLNHKAAADKTEKCLVVDVDPEDRTKEISEPHEIEGWLGFEFPGRGDKYSQMKWHWEHFSGTDYDAASEKTAIYKIQGEFKAWAAAVDTEKGNFDYLMFADIDHAHPEVKQDINDWGVWIAKLLSLRGMRFDAVKHFSEDYLREFIENLKANVKEDFFFVGEFWKDSLADMTAYLDRMEGSKFSLFDAPLVYNFSEASKTESYDLRKIYNGSLVQARPVAAVTLVMNHDTQPHQALEAPIEGFFKPLAYALILLRREGYPCVFWGDLEGILGEFAEEPSCGGQLPDIILARKLYAYGDQNDYFDFETCVGWVRRGTWDKPDGMAVVISNAGPGEKRMFVGEDHKNEVWTDVLGWQKGEVKIGEDGYATFTCPAVSMAIWVKDDAYGRDQFGSFKAGVGLGKE